MTTQTQTMAPFIDRDIYVGRWTFALKPGGRNIVLTMTAREVAEWASEGVIWASFGHPRGRVGEHFKRDRYVAAPNGDLWVYSSDGSLAIIHPADRVLRILGSRS